MTASEVHQFPDPVLATSRRWTAASLRKMGQGSFRSFAWLCSRSLRASGRLAEPVQTPAERTFGFAYKPGRNGKRRMIGRREGTLEDRLCFGGFACGGESLPQPDLSANHGGIVGRELLAEYFKGFTDDGCGAVWIATQELRFRNGQHRGCRIRCRVASGKRALDSEGLLANFGRGRVIAGIEIQ